MPKIPNVSYRQVVKIFAQLGYEIEPKRGKGSHILMSKSGVLRPVVIPRQKSLSAGVIGSLIRASGLERQEFIDLLD